VQLHARRFFGRKGGIMGLKNLRCVHLAHDAAITCTEQHLRAGVFVGKVCS
jgi:hypothetical protein